MPSAPLFILHENYLSVGLNTVETDSLLSSFQHLCVDCKEEDDNEERIVRTKKKRLLLVRHASTCGSDGRIGRRCAIGPQCTAAKRLCLHIKTCTDGHCTYSNCLSTRYIITHYRKCKDIVCPVCVPVEISIQSSLRKEIIAPGKLNVYSRLLSI